MKLASRAWCMALVLTLTLWANHAVQAAPSCGLESWIIGLNAAANTYISVLGTSEELSAERAFRAQMERYPRDRLVKQIQSAQLGTNKNALNAFISARRHLYNLSKDNWSEMAMRFGTDPLFIQQSKSMANFLLHTHCDPIAEDFLNETNSHASLLKRISTQVAKLIKPTPHASTQSDLILKSSTLDRYRSQMGLAQNTTTSTASESSSSMLILLGIFTFVISAAIWFWMRLGIAHRRASRYPCNLPVVIFDGAMPTLGDLRDINPFGAKVETPLNAQINSKLLLTMNKTKRKVRVMWANTHFIGVKFDVPLSEAEITDLLDDFSDSATRSKESSDGFAAFLEETYNLPAQPLTDYLSSPTEMRAREIPPDDVEPVVGEYRGVTLKSAFSDTEAQAPTPEDEIPNSEISDGETPNDMNPLKEETQN
ncbi:PilZ domain-containing protein [Pacificibacter marinus]|nr:PilZ domain-containing protein [Pacificibacter marinus]